MSTNYDNRSGNNSYSPIIGVMGSVAAGLLITAIPSVVDNAPDYLGPLTTLAGMGVALVGGGLAIQRDNARAWNNSGLEKFAEEEQ